MNRQKLASLVSLLTVVTVGAVTYSLYLPDLTRVEMLPDGGWGEVAVTLADLSDAGAGEPTHALSCPVRVSPECQERFGVKRYERVRFGVVMGPLASGKRDVIFPPLGRVRQCVELIDFKHCTATPCASAAAVCAKFGNANPFSLVAGDRQCARKNTARGFSTCARLSGRPLIEQIILPVSQLTGNCEPVGLPLAESGAHCYILAGDNPEEL